MRGRGDGHHAPLSPSSSLAAASVPELVDTHTCPKQPLALKRPHVPSTTPRALGPRAADEDVRPHSKRPGSEHPPCPRTETQPLRYLNPVNFPELLRGCCQ